MKKLFCLFALLALLCACNSEEHALESANALHTRSISGDSLYVDATFLKLVDDTTRLTAAVLEISAPVEEVSVKWNVLPGFNIDTTAVNLRVANGRTILPINWKNCIKSHQHAPAGTMFEGGVIITAGNQAKYVRLLYAQKIDSVQLAANPVIMDTPESPYPQPRSITIIPEVLPLHPDAPMGMWVDIKGGTATLDFTQIQAKYNIDVDNINVNGAINNIMDTSGPLIFNWTAAGPPAFSFFVRIPISYTNDGITTTRDVYIYYDAPGDFTFYNLDFVLPDGVGYVSAQNGSVSVGVTTNEEWSFTCGALGKIPQVIDRDNSTLKARTLTMEIQDNPGPTERRFPVIIFSKGVVKDTVYVTQQGLNPPVVDLRYKSNTIADPIPKAGGTYSITFEGTYAGPLQVRPIIAGVPDTPVQGTLVPTNQRLATFTIPQNPNTTNRTVTFQYSTDGVTWVNVSNETDRIQLGTDGGETSDLEYDFSNLPPGNIPQPGYNCIFTFKGTYKGRLRVRASVNGVWYTGDMSSTLVASVNVPANNTPDELPVKFQYRAFDANPSEWKYLPASTQRMQDALKDFPVTGVLTPAGGISEWGQTFQATFSGQYTGDIYLRASVKSGDVIVGPITGKVGTAIPISIPQLNGPKRTIVFEYAPSPNGPWKVLDERDQINETLSFGQLMPNLTQVPPGGGTCSIRIYGTYSKNITVTAWDDIEGQKVKIDTKTSTVNPEHIFELVIPANPRNVPRAIAFTYKREDIGLESMIEIRTQQVNK